MEIEEGEWASAKNTPPPPHPRDFHNSVDDMKSLGDKGLFSSANILQIAHVVRRVVFLLFLLFF